MKITYFTCAQTVLSLFGALMLIGATMGCGGPLEKLGARLMRDDYGKIVKVDLSGTQTTDEELVHLKGLPRLLELNLSNTAITDVGLSEHIEGLTSLLGLDLSKTEVTDTGLEHVKRLNQVLYLILSDTKITDVGLKQLKHLTRLKQLVLSNTEVTDEGLEYVKGLTHLTKLDISGTKTTYTGAAELKDDLPNCFIAR